MGFFDVVEHLEDALRFWKAIKGRRERGGRLYATVPAYQVLWSALDVVAGCAAPVISISGGSRRIRAAAFSRRMVRTDCLASVDNGHPSSPAWKEQQVGHESYERSEQVRGSSDRSFGIVFAVVFAVIGLLPLAFGGAARLWALMIGAAFLVVALLAPTILAPMNRVWLRFGLLLHRIVSPLVLGIMFFLVITPMGLVMRAFGKDLLRLKFDQSLASYWIERSPPGPAPESMKDQF